MAYRRLDFEQYFIDNSEDYNHTGKASKELHYKAVTYQCTGLEKLFRFQHEMNYEIHYEKERDVIQINFQKTNGFSDWIANIVEFTDKYYDAFYFEGQMLCLRAHHGWANMYRSIKNEIRLEWSRLHKKYQTAETEIIGWSLGSAQAILCCQDLNYNFGVCPYLYTFGSVRPFKYTFFNRCQMKQYLNSIYKEGWNFANVNDIVTYMPPFLGFIMPNRVKVGLEGFSIKKLLQPGYYHTIYDNPELYRNCVSAKSGTIHKACI